MSALRDAFEEIVADVPVYGDVDRAVDRARRDQRRRSRAAVCLAAAAAVVAVIVSLVAVNGNEAHTQEPIAPPTTTVPTTTASPSPVPWEPPGPLRPATSRLVSTASDSYGNPLAWTDPRDAASAGIDIVSVDEGHDFQGGSSWRFVLAARTPRDPIGRVIAYGITVDGNGDHRADCQIGVNNDGPEDGDLHVWVTNLRTHETAVQDGPPYGVPVEFAHPAEDNGIEGAAPEMQFGFLTGLTHPGPCDRFGGSPTFYAWSSLTLAGQVVETDYAPDAAWLPVHCHACRRS